jgi:hypothetical protein
LEEIFHASAFLGNNKGAEPAVPTGENFVVFSVSV